MTSVVRIVTPGELEGIQLQIELDFKVEFSIWRQCVFVNRLVLRHVK